MMKDLSSSITVEKGESRGPINFANVRLQTGKVPQLPKLPQINDVVITKT